MKEVRERVLSSVFAADGPWQKWTLVPLEDVLRPQSLSAEPQGGGADELNSGDAVAESLLEVELTGDDVPISACRRCAAALATREEQIAHYRSPWHRYNLKQSLRARPAVTEEQFDELSSSGGASSQPSRTGVVTEGSSDESSGDDEAAGDNVSLRRLVSQGCRRYFLRKDAGVDESVVSVYRSAVVGVPGAPSTTSHVDVVLLLAGGRFAGAVFDRGSVVIHKAFNRYTVRAKQGGAQGLRDSQQAHHAPKSAGANLRRYNEHALARDIDELLNGWQAHLGRAEHIFLRCSTYHQCIFVGDDKRAAPLSRGDPRVCSIPFVTRRPTFDEAVRVYCRLTTVFDHGPLPDFLNRHSQPAAAVRQKAPPQRVKPPRVRSASASSIESEPSKPVAVKSKSQAAVLPSENATPATPTLPPELYTPFRLGDVDALQLALDADSSGVRLKALLDCRLSGGNGCLHESAAAGNVEMVSLLLRLGCDPCHTNDARKVPYQVCADKLTRRAFVDFRAEAAEAYACDWRIAQIPERRSDAEEAETARRVAERKRAARQRQKERSRVQQESAAVERREEEERRRYLALSDREKRALAAERRILAAAADTPKETSAPVLSRCFQCASDITGKVPFEYSSNRFCSVACVKAHRTAV